MTRSIQIAFVKTGLLVAVLYAALEPQIFHAYAQAQPPTQSTRIDTPDWEVLDRREGLGEQCLVCNKQVFDADVVLVRYQGRTFHVAAGKMFNLFEKNPEQYFRKLQARSALFDEKAIRPSRLSVAWLGLGVYVLLGLVGGGICGYLAISKGLSPMPWFFAGLVGNGIVLIVLLGTKGGNVHAAPAGIPPGLTKVPTTHWPIACETCGATNHPSATSCSSCNNRLEPTVTSEVSLT